MAEYIERELAIKALSRGEGCGSICRRAIERIPVADVAPVRHGRWIEHDDGVFTCSECGNAESNESYFCRYCGAIMDLEG